MLVFLVCRKENFSARRSVDKEQKFAIMEMEKGAVRKWSAPFSDNHSIKETTAQVC